MSVTTLNNTPFYKVALNLAEMSMRGNLVKIVAPTQVIANQIAICVASLAKLLQGVTGTPRTPVPATASYVPTHAGGAGESQ